MRIANLSGRCVLVVDDRAVDVEQASEGRFPSDPQLVLADFETFRSWASQAPLPPGQPFDPGRLGSPVPAPRQVFAIGLNYRPHADEAGFAAPSLPMVFTKFPTAVTGPFTEVATPVGDVDWEVELVAVMGRPASRVGRDRAWEYVAGLTVGQDISERRLQMVGSPAQFSLAKSYPGFAPLGPHLVTPDEFADPNDLEISCDIDGETVQYARTSEMIYSVAELVEFLSGVVTLLPGDVVFTGTPAGVGLGRVPARYLQVGQVLTSTVEGIGSIRQVFVAARQPPK